MTKQPTRLAMELDPDTIQAIISDTVAGQIAAAMQASGVDFAEYVVKTLVESKIDRDGKIIPRGHYDYSRTKETWFEKQLQELILNCAKESMATFVEEQKPKIQDAMMKAFKRRTPQIVRAMTDGTMAAFEKKWGFRFDLTLKPE